MRSEESAVWLRPATAMLAAFLMMVSSGWGAVRERVIHSFLARPSIHPRAGLVFDKAGNLYGTAAGGGNGPGSYGTVFKLSPTVEGGVTYSVIHVFKGADGATPLGTLVFDSVGDLYGTTQYGGKNDRGTVFELTPSPNGTWTETTLYSFGAESGPDASEPEAGVIFDAAGTNLYGTTSAGGVNGLGAVFELSPVGGGWNEAVLYSFDGSSGASPFAPLVFDSGGNLYGTTYIGGAGFGTVFELANAFGSWTENVLYSFANGMGNPYSALVFDSDGNLFGTTQGGGVFKLSPTRDGNWMESVISDLAQCGGNSLAPLIFDQMGNLYGTTSGQATGGVFRLTPSQMASGQPPAFISSLAARTVVIPGMV